MSERAGQRVNYRVEQNLYDNEGVTLVYLNPEDDSEMGRENLSLFILTITGLTDLVLHHPDQLEIKVEERTNGKITAVSIQRKN